jgi:hypothetical protein
MAKEEKMKEGEKIGKERGLGERSRKNECLRWGGGEVRREAGGGGEKVGGGRRGWGGGLERKRMQRYWPWQCVA